MKQTNRTLRFTAAALTLTLGLGLTACGGTAPAAETPEEVLTKAQEALAGVTSMGYDMTMDLSMGAEGETLAISTVTRADTVLSPLAMKAEMEIDLGDLGGTTSMTIYAKEQDGSYLTAVGTPDEAGQMTWQSSSMDALGELENLSGADSMQLYLDSIQNFTQGESETVNGVEATRYDGVILGEDLSEVIAASGALSQLDSLGMGEMSELFKGMGDLPVSLWIAKETYYPVKYEMDLTEMMQSILDKTLSEQLGDDIGLTVEQAALSMTIRDINQVGEIEIPAEALET